MKKAIKLLSILLAALILFVPIGAVADGSTNTGLVRDHAGLLTEDGAQSIESLAKSASERCQADIVIFTTDDADISVDGAYEKQYFIGNGYGYGENRSGIMLLINYATRDFSIDTFGNVRDHITDNQLSYIRNSVAGDLSAGDNFEALVTFVSCAESTISSPDFYETEKEFSLLKTIGISFVVAMIISLIVNLVYRNQLRSEFRNDLAEDYIVQGSVNIHERRDMFLYSKVSSVRKTEQASGSGGNKPSETGRTTGKF